MLNYSKAKNDRLQRSYEFIEVLLSQKDNEKIQNRWTHKPDLFETSTEKLIVKDFTLKKVSIRLRTINNACDSAALLSDGSDITEMSIYGSRCYRYFHIPYSVVKELMDGEFTSYIHPLKQVEIQKQVEARKNQVEAQKKIEIIKTIEASGQKIILCKNQLNVIRANVVAKKGLIRCLFNERQHQFQMSDIPVMDKYIDQLTPLIASFQELLEQCTIWFEKSLTPELHQTMREKYTALIDKFKEVLNRFEIDLYPELQPSRACN